MLRSLIILLLACCAPACKLFQSPPPGVPVPPRESAAPGRTPVPPPRPARPTATVESLTFQLDPARSSGHIATTLDPHGLGPRHAQCRCPLRGSLRGELTSRPDGSRSLQLHHIELATSGDGHLSFEWSPVIGRIQTLIPSGRLNISRRNLPGPLHIGSAGRFEKAGSSFTVDGIAKVSGTGLVLRRKVGETETDLSIDQTDAVQLTGTLLRRDGTWVLHVPAAVLRDRYELDAGRATLDLAFTATITAVAR